MIASLALPALLRSILFPGRFQYLQAFRHRKRLLPFNGIFPLKLKGTDEKSIPLKILSPTGYHVYTQIIWLILLDPGKGGPCPPGKIKLGFLCLYPFLLLLRMIRPILQKLIGILKITA